MFHSWKKTKTSLLTAFGESAYSRLAFQRSAAENLRLMNKRRSTVESLEPRQMLAIDTAFISEFMAVNSTTLTDSDNEFTDWIEVHNPTSEAINLENWSLTDDVDRPQRWTFPVGVSLDPGAFLVVFASGNNRLDPAAELHTNFKLGGGGEYLALNDPTGTVVHEFSPEYPQQQSDVSYGITTERFDLVVEDDDLDVFVPTDDSLGTDWAQPDFIVDDSWTSTSTTVGFGGNSDAGFAPFISGFTVRDIRSSTAITSLETSEALLAGEGVIDDSTLKGVPVINYFHQSDDAHFPNSAPFPNGGGNNFVILSTGTIVIETEGEYTFGMTHDDGGRLTLDGEDIIVDNVRKGNHDIFSEPIFLTAGNHEIEHLKYQNSRAAETELYAAVGAHTSFNDNFKLIGDTQNGGLEVFTVADGTGISDIGEQMKGVNSSAYIRAPFRVTSAAQIRNITMDIKYNDGFVAYLNGQEVARRNAPDILSWDAAATAERTLNETLSTESIDLSDHVDKLQDGDNVLAIQGLNSDPNNDSFLISPRLTATGDLSLNAEDFFPTPTPGAANIAGKASVEFSIPGSTFVGSTKVELSSDVSNGIIRFTTDNSQPGARSTVYSGPLTVNQTTEVRAQVFSADDNSPLSPIFSQTYVRISNELLTFSSDLPVIVFNTFGTNVTNNGQFVPASFAMFEPEEVGGESRTSLTSTPTVQSRSAIEVRGSSTGGQPKSQYKLEIRDEQDADKDLELLGMPRESDWVLHAPYTWDRSFLHNAFFYGVSNKIGQYAPRTRFVEVYVNRNDGEVTQSDYMGLYVLLEKIKQGEDRVDIDPLVINADGTAEGGFIIKQDRGDDDGEPQFTAGRTGSLNYVEPKEIELTPDQRAHINGFLNDFGDALFGPDFEDEELGYAQFVDVDTWIDSSIINMLPMNVDAYRLSGYFHVNNDQKIVYGPAWDCDRCLESNDGRDNDPLRWEGPPDSSRVFSDNRYPWWGRIFQDPNFQQKFKDRWVELREDVLSTENVLAFVDELADIAREAADRDAARWPGVGFRSSADPQLNGTFQGEVDNMKDWLVQRMEWVDNEIATRPLPVEVNSDFPRPTFDTEAGVVAPGTEVRLATTLSRTPIYYTLDGSDPRAANGGIAENAIKFSSPIVIDDSTLVTARVRVGAVWTAKATAQFFINTPASADNLALTELNYNPSNPSEAELAILNPNNDENIVIEDGDFEFVELQNISDSIVDLGSSRFREGIDFRFSRGSVQSLAPGERVVVVRNQAAFEARYGNNVNVAGSFEGTLENNGEAILLEDANGDPIFEFDYDDGGRFPNRADGNGSTLELIDPTAIVAADFDYGDGANWRSSAEFNGTPGAGGSGPAVTVVVNEVLSNSDGQLIDSIELFNTTDASIDVSHWFLSDSTGDYQKFQIPAGTSIAAGDYLVFDENDFNAAGDENGFALDGSRGEDVWLLSGDTDGNLGSFIDHVEFDAARSNETLGRWPNGSGELVAMTSETLGSENSGPISGDVIISEVMYDALSGADDDDLEFVEVYNTTGQEIDLTGWRLRKGISFSFDDGTTIGPGGTIVVISFNPDNPDNAARVTAFRDHYGIDDSVVLVGGYGGQLDDGGERIQLQEPDTPPIDEPDFTPHPVVDSVRYDDSAPWPETADGGGDTLNRTAIDAFGNFADSWSGDAATPGSVSFVPPSTDVFVDALVGGSDWSIDSILVGTTNPLVDIATLAVLPWSNINQISYVFSGDVNVSEGDLSVVGVNVADYGLAAGGFEYDAAARTATWTLDSAIGADKVLLALADTVTDANGEPISGSQFGFNVLPGDADLSGEVDMLDVDAMRTGFLTSVGEAGYSNLVDFNANGSVDIRDLQSLRSNLLNTLPESEPALALFALLDEFSTANSTEDDDGDSAQSWDDAVDQAFEDDSAWVL